MLLSPRVMASNAHWAIDMDRLEELKRELARRIAPVLRDVPTEQFEEIVHVMAMLQYKYDMRRRRDPEVDVRDGERNVP